MAQEETTYTREQLIEQLSVLIKTEEQIGKAIQQKKEIMEAWSKLSEDSSGKTKQQTHTFFKLVEEFNYNINIYKAIQEHDLKRNQQLKENILKKLEELIQKGEHLGDTFKVLQKEWFDVGPVKKELREEFLQKFKDLSQIIIDKLTQYKVESKAKELENLKAKEAIISFIENVLNDPATREKQWKLKTDLVLEKQAEWKNIGHVPKEKSNALWNKYRAACDHFFKEKSVFYDSLKEGFQQHKKEKLDLCDAAQAIINDSTKSNNDKAFELTKIQRKWKEVKQAHPRDEQKLWLKFQEICNSFFNEIKKQKEEEKANDLLALQKKNEILQKLEFITSKDDILAQLKEWFLTDNIETPSSLSNTFFTKINSLLSAQNLSSQEISELIFNHKIECYKELNIEGIFNNDINYNREHIKKLEEEKIKFENNLGFFKNTKNDNPMIIELREKVSKMEKDIEVYKTRLQTIKKAIKKQSN